MVQRALPMHKEKYSDKKLLCPKLCGFDIETEGLGGKYVCGAIWTTDAQRRSFSNLDDLLDWIINHPEYRFLAHNASGYEFAYLYPLLYSRFAGCDNIELVPTLQGDSRVIQLRIIITEREKLTRRGKPTKTIIDIRDTLCLFNMSLEKVAKAFCPELPKLKGNINFEKETFDPNNELHMQYLFRDCEIVVKAYEKHWNDVKEVFCSPLGVTAGSTALKAFKTTIPEGHVYYRVNREVEQFIRQAYYGGWVNPGRTVGEWGSVGCLDVNGAYAFQMSTHLFPVGSPVGTYAYNPNLVGFYQCDCIVPDSVYNTLGFNPIPKKTENGLSWPSGTFETYLSTPEIEFARKRGCTVNVICGYEFHRFEAIFDGFIKKCQEMEKVDNFKYKPTIKGIRNSGYGKFGAKEEHKTLIFSHSIVENYEPLVNEKTGKIIPGIYIGQEIQDADYMMPHWAALITAYERLYIMEVAEYAYKLGAKNVYCDTDSIKCDLNVCMQLISMGYVKIGNDYGEYKIEETCSSFILLGGKCFYGDTDDTSSTLMKAKGIPKKLLTKEVYQEGLEQLTKKKRNGKEDKIDKDTRGKEFYSVESVMNIVKQQSHVKPVKRKRRITDIRNSYAWQLKDNKIYPRGYTL